MVDELRDRAVIVTGAAADVGLAIARRFARSGAKLMLADRNEAALEREIAALRETEGEGTAEIQGFHEDLRKRLSISNLVAATVDAFDRLDVVVLADRYLIASDPLNPDDPAFEESLLRNLTARLRLCQIAARRMIALAEDAGRPAAGAMVVIGSIQSRRTMPALGAYAISMAASDQMTRSLAAALGPQGIRVNTLALGCMPSAALAQALGQDGDMADIHAKIAPLGRAGSLDEAAEAALFLASDRSAYMTGQILAVDGGASLRDPIAFVTADRDADD